MKLRRDFPVTSNGPLAPDLHYWMEPQHNEHGELVCFLLWCEQQLIADCESAKRLSDWAFEHHAQSVRCAFDWKLADSEP